MLKTWIMVNVYSFLSSFITYIANVMIFFDCKQLCRCTFLLFNILDLLANIYSLSIHPIRDKKSIYILLEHLLYITWAFIIYYLGIYYILTLTDFTLHFSCCFTKILHSQLNPLLNNFTMQEKCY